MKPGAPTLIYLTYFNHHLPVTQSVRQVLQLPDYYRSSVWDSGKIQSNESIYVAYGGMTLNSSTAYQWTVVTWTDVPRGGSPCQSAPSDAAIFVTSLFDIWHESAKFIRCHYSLQQPDLFPNLSFPVTLTCIYIPAPTKSRLSATFAKISNFKTLFAASPWWLPRSMISCCAATSSI